MLSSRRLIERREPGRCEIREAMPITTGISAATPAPKRIAEVVLRALCPMRSAASRPAPRPIAACENAITPEAGRFSPNFSRERFDMRIDRRLAVWDFQLQMKRALGIDLGEARVGVALSDELGMLAHPLETIQVKAGNVRDRIVAIAREKNVDTIVVGMPRNMDGSFGPAAIKAREFISGLETVSPCPVVPWDERLTTVSAERSLQESGRKARDQRQVIDQVAAQILLQSWLDSRA